MLPRLYIARPIVFRKQRGCGSASRRLWRAEGRGADSQPFFLEGELLSTQRQQKLARGPPHLALHLRNRRTVDNPHSPGPASQCERKLGAYHQH
jgi:hypothetical protein